MKSKFPIILIITFSICGCQKQITSTQTPLPSSSSDEASTSTSTQLPPHVSLPLQDGTIDLTEERLTQEEYYSLVDCLLIPERDFKYTFDVEKYQGKNVTYSTHGEYAVYDKERENDTAYSIELYTSQMETGAYFSANTISRHYDTYSSYSHIVYYVTCGGELDFGSIYDNGYGVITRSYDSNRPIDYWVADSGEVVNTTLEQYRAFRLLNSYGLQNYFQVGGASNLIAKSNNENGPVDKPIFSHEITSDYLIIYENRKVFPINNSLPSTLIINPDHYYNTKYYYDKNSGELMKKECTFNAADFVSGENIEFSGKYTFEYQKRDYNQIKKISDDHEEAFMNRPNIITTVSP